VTTFSTDFSNYAIGNLSATGDWTVLATTGNWHQTVVALGGTINGQAAEIARSTTGDAINCVVNSTIGYTTGDIEVLCHFRPEGTIQNDSSFRGPALTTNGTTSSVAYCYGVSYPTTGASLVLGLANNYGAWAYQTNLNGFTGPYTLTSNQWVWVRLGRSGTTIRLKTWNGTFASEPGGPTGWSTGGVNTNGGAVITATNTTLSSVGACLGWYDFTESPMHADWFGIGSGSGVVAPGPPTPPSPPLIYTSRRVIQLDSTVYY